MARVKGKGLRDNAAKTSNQMQDPAVDDRNDDGSPVENGETAGLRRSSRQRQLRQAAAVAATTASESPESADEDYSMQDSPQSSTRAKARYRKGKARQRSDDNDSEGSPRRRNASRRSSMLKDQDGNKHALNWIRQNYEYHDNHNVPRSGMFEHYKTSASLCNLPVVNAATFGKLIRHVFPNITTRRLGTRGMSKYHYCGIRRKLSVTGFMQTTPAYLASSPEAEQQRVREPAASKTLEPLQPEVRTPGTRQNYESFSLSEMCCSQASSSQMEDYQEYPPYEPLEVQLPSFSSIVQTGIEFHDEDAVVDFATMYEIHCYRMLHNVQAGKVNLAMSDLVEFYDNLPQSTRHLITTEPNLADAIWRWDCALYDTILISLIPSMLATIPFEMIRASRQYTNQLVKHLIEALVKYPENLREKKIQAANVFVSRFCRHLKLNQMAQSAAALLRNAEIVEAMRTDWEKIDVDNILDETQWVCACDPALVERFFREKFPALLHSGVSIEILIAWIEDVVKRWLPMPAPPLANENATKEVEDYLYKAKQTVLQWNMYSTLALKDLATSGAATTDHFRILRLFMDDYLLYCVEGTIAKWASDDDATQGELPMETVASPSSMGGNASNSQTADRATNDQNMDIIPNELQ